MLGAANQHVLWAVLATWAYIAFHIWRLDEPKESIRLLSRALIYGVAECPFYGPTSVFPVGLLLKAPNNHDEDSD